MIPNFALVKEKDRFKAFRSYIGRHVAEIAYCQYAYNGKPPCEEDGSLEICFTDTSCLTCSIANDGESISISPTPLPIPETIDIGDGNIWAWKRVILTDMPQWSILKGCQLTNIETILDIRIPSQQETVSGCRLTFSNNNMIIFCNAGDNARFTLNDIRILKPLHDVITQFESILSHSTA